METLLSSVNYDYPITPREKEILQMIVDGYSNKEIGDQLSISVRTVEAHRQNLFRKFDVDNIVKLVRLALDKQLVS
jgi:DNA-binding CsgD family transcriptional regulator